MKLIYLIILILLSLIICFLNFYIENQYLLFAIIIFIISLLAFLSFIILTLLSKKRKSSLKIKIISHVSLLITMAFIGGLLLSNKILFPLLLHLNQKQIDKLIVKIYDFNNKYHRYPNNLNEIKLNNSNIPIDFTSIVPRSIYYHKYNNNFIITYGNFHNMVSIYCSKNMKWARKDDYENNIK